MTWRGSFINGHFCDEHTYAVRLLSDTKRLSLLTGDWNSFDLLYFRSNRLDLNDTDDGCVDGKNWLTNHCGSSSKSSVYPKKLNQVITPEQNGRTSPQHSYSTTPVEALQVGGCQVDTGFWLIVLQCSFGLKLKIRLYVIQVLTLHASVLNCLTPLSDTWFPWYIGFRPGFCNGCRMVDYYVPWSDHHLMPCVISYCVFW